MEYTELIMLIWIEVMLFDKCVPEPVLQPDPVIAAAEGEDVTLQCFLLEEQNTDPVVWYKQAAGHEPSLVAVVQKVQTPIYNKELNSTRFRIEKGLKICNLKIISVEASDEAMYYCGMIKFYTVFAEGTFLSVKHDKGLNVRQSGVSDWVPAGASVTLQCSVLSESRTAELQVFWFRAAPSQSHPQIIYTHHNSRHQCESDSSTHTCVYNMSKNILSLNDTGTYYCAVALCGKIVFGNGTRVQMENSASSNPVVVCLGTVLVMCGILISVQAALLCKRKNSQQYRERIQHGAVANTEKTNTRDCDALELNYAALQFNDQKNKRVKENRGRSKDSVYSEVKFSSINH